MPNSVKLTGWKEFENNLKTLPRHIKTEVSHAVKDAGDTWEERAKLAAPTDQGLLKGSITSKRTGEMSAEVTSPAEYSAYIEWGTKTRVKVPSELQAYAAQFRGGGKGAGNARLMIYAWMNRVGIPKERQWFVFISIVTKGIHPQPYFFIQRPFVEKQLLDDLKHITSAER